MIAASGSPTAPASSPVVSAPGAWNPATPAAIALPQEAANAAASVGEQNGALAPIATSEAAQTTPAPSLSSSPPSNQARRDRGNKNMTFDERREMLDFLLARRADPTGKAPGKLARNAINEAAIEFSVDRRTVSRLWKRAAASLERGEPVCDVASRKVGRQGRRKRDWSAALEKVREVPVEQRGSIRALASAVGIPKTTLFELLREDPSPLRALNSIKPALTERNKLERLRYCHSKLRPNGLFDDMFNMVHVNVKWFSLPRDKKVRVMCLTAIARPQWDIANSCRFDGKIGIWPFLKAAADGEYRLDRPLDEQTDVNMDTNGQPRPSPGVDQANGNGTTGSHISLTAMETVSKDDVQRMLASVVIPEIRRKMPSHLKAQPIFIQQDSAKIRSAQGDPVLAEEGRRYGWHIALQNPPPYSPDFTVLDNAVFKHIERAIKDMPVPPRTAALAPLEELVHDVQAGFQALTREHLDDAFLSLQKVLECTMLVQGANTYELEGGATGRDQFERDGSLPVSILCKPEAAVACRAAIEKQQLLLQQQQQQQQQEQQQQQQIQQHHQLQQADAVMSGPSTIV